jgi:thiol-disulfide isomerase/thioredoxin
MKKLLFLIVFAPLIAKSQRGLLWNKSSFFNFLNSSYLYREDGVQWTEGLSWQQVKEKAKRENKYIFLDCFTTWCGPCKKMDHEVYTDEKIGRFFSNKFISVKVQMDRTKDDNDFIKSWYNDAAEIGKHYLLEGYPTLLFFSPSGIIVQKETGFKNIKDLMILAQAAIQPGKSLNDDYAEYRQLLNNYKQGKIPYERLPFMVTIAKKLGDTISLALVKTHAEYVSTLMPEKRFSKENIEFWSSLNLSVKSILLQYFFKNGDQIDKVMNKEGFSRHQVNKCIQNFIVEPFLSSQYKNPDANSGLTKINTRTGQAIPGQAYYEEADWKKLSELMRKDFNASYVKSNLLQAKSTWYYKNNNWESFAKASIKQMEIDSPDFDNWRECQAVNNLGWTVFLYLNEKKLINGSLVWMKKLVENKPKWGACLDTYANLLYKAGKREVAIQWQEKAVNVDPTNKGRQKALEQMKNGKPTYEVNRL